MAYREKPDLVGVSIRQKRRERLYILWLVPVFVLAPNMVRISKALGFKATYDIAVAGTVALTALCVVGAIASYRRARAQAARDLNEVTGRSG